MIEEKDTRKRTSCNRCKRIVLRAQGEGQRATRLESINSAKQNAQAILKKENEKENELIAKLV